MKKYCYLLFLLSFTEFSYSQTQPDSNYLNYNIHKINLTIIGVSYSYEHALTKRLSVSNDIEFAYNFIYRENTMIGSKYDDAIYPILSSELRYYHNLESRVKKSKNVVNNSANYFGLMIGYRFNSIKRTNFNSDNILFLYPNYGIQRTYMKSKLSLDFHFGLTFNYKVTTSEKGISPLLLFKIGYII